ncbi:MAG: type IV pilus assembly protein PilM [Acidobacteriota bacterium]
MFFSRSKPIVGLDIGTSSVKAAVLKARGRGRGYALTHFAVEPLPSEVIVEGSIMDSGPVVEAINRVCAAGGIRHNEVAVSLSGHSVIVKRVSIPSMTEEELAESIHWEAEQYIPFDVEDVNIDYQILGDVEEQKDQMDVLLVAVKKDKINDYTSVISQAGRIPVVVDVDVFAVQNIFEINYEQVPDETVALINMGAAVTNVAILNSGNPQFWRDLSVGGNQYTEALQRELGVSFEEAEDAKMGKVAEISAEQTEPILSSVTQEVVSEIQKTVDFYLSSNSDEQLDRVVLSGGGTRLESLPGALTERFDCDVEHLDPFRSVTPDGRHIPQESLQELASSAAVAVGLATRKVGDK